MNEKDFVSVFTDHFLVKFAISLNIKMPCLTLDNTHRHLVNYCIDYLHVSDILKMWMLLIGDGICRKAEIPIIHAHNDACEHLAKAFIFMIFNLSNDLLERALDVIATENAFFSETLWAEYFIVRGFQADAEECRFIYE